MKYKYLIVGAGITGLTAARCLAEKGNRVLVVDKRGHIGGNCDDGYDQHGILVHRYGPHIFHTTHEVVWTFLSRFTAWHEYQHKVLAYVEGQYVPLPVNLDTLNQLYNLHLTPETMEQYLASQCPVMDVVENSRDSVISRFGVRLYEQLFQNYTLKQWGIGAELLAPEVCGRIPVRYNRDGRYFADPFQGLPAHGYRKMFQNMADHPHIDLMLQVDYADIVSCLPYEKTIYTGPVDAYFGYRYGPLGYRSLRFEWRHDERSCLQKAAVINYPNDYEFTRSTEYKKMTGQRTAGTTLSYEYSLSDGEPYYPIPTDENERLYQKYKQDAEKTPNVFFAGRLGTYKYLNMDIACLQALRLAQGL